MKLAILNCRKADEVCAGCGCLRAFFGRTGAFARYESAPMELIAFLRCNGCGRKPEEDAGMLEKLERLKTEGVEIVHLGICTRSAEKGECPTITRLAAMLTERGMAVVRGTH